MEYICPSCKTIFKAKPSRQKRSKQVFCSPECYHFNRVGKKLPPERCKNIGLGHIGLKHTEESKAKMSLAQKGKFVSKKTREKASLRMRGKQYHWKGGRVIRPKYINIYSPDHPLRDSSNYVREHRLVAEKVLKRYLTRIEVIHHIDENPHNNAPENLYLFASQSDHAKFHSLTRKNPSIKILKSNLV